MRESLELTREENVEDARRALAHAARDRRVPEAGDRPHPRRRPRRRRRAGRGLRHRRSLRDDALFGFTETRLGILPAVISPFVAGQDRALARARAVPDRRTLRAPRARRRSGLVHEVVAGPRTRRGGRRAVVREHLQRRPTAIAAIKRCWRASSSDGVRRDARTHRQPSPNSAPARKAKKACAPSSKSAGRRAAALTRAIRAPADRQPRRDRRAHRARRRAKPASCRWASIPTPTRTPTSCEFVDDARCVGPGARARIVSRRRTRLAGGARAARRRGPSRLRLSLRAGALRAKPYSTRALIFVGPPRRARSRRWAIRPKPNAARARTACRWCPATTATINRPSALEREALRDRVRRC